MQTYNLTVLKSSDFRSWEIDTVPEDDGVFDTYDDARMTARGIALKYLQKLYPEEFEKFSQMAYKLYPGSSEGYAVWTLDQFYKSCKMDWYDSKCVYEHHTCTSDGPLFVIVIYSDTISPINLERKVLYRIEIGEGFKDATLIGYKAFDENMKCYGGFQYEIGEEYTIKELPIVCFRGFHFCEKLFHCFDYYDSSTAIICKVEASGNISRIGNKFCTNNIKILERINLDDYKE